MITSKFKAAHAWYPDNLPFTNIKQSFDRVNPGELTKNNILILWGGEDIATEIYNQKPNKYVHTYTKSERDKEEIALAHEAINLGIPIIGICRGAQLLCCLTGGSLIQHIENHITNKHSIICPDEPGKFYTNSCHHQMMIPTKEQKILAYALETTGFGEQNIPIEITNVPEIVYFPKIKALGIQGHPEWESMPKTFNHYCQQLIEQLLLC